MFGFKKKIDPDLQYIISKIGYNTNPPKKTYEVTVDEELFLIALVTYMKSKRQDPRKIKLVRLSDGTFNVELPSQYLGKVCLQGKKKYIQFMRNTYVAETVHAESVDILIPYISKWIK